MKRLEYTVRFNTPAFLGNAEQSGQWRTPPFKALLRQWWRVVKAKEVDYDHTRLRAEEMHLFGAASDSGSEKSHRSLVLLRLSSWDEGTLSEVGRGEMVAHREVPRGQVGANLYLGYGPIGGQTRSAIDPESVAHMHALSICCPDERVQEIRKAMQLAVWFGTIGSRSRNGWGALDIVGEGIKGFTELDAPALASLVTPRPLDDCLKTEWLHAVGSDGAGVPLVWRLLKVNQEKREIDSFASWEEAMKELTRIKIKVRTSTYFIFVGGGRDGHANPLPRHVLSYPAGRNHRVTAKGWGQDGRLANQILFKVHRRGSGFAATIAHFPSRVPAHMAERVQLPDQAAVWREVHRLLDAEKPGLRRINGAQA